MRRMIIVGSPRSNGRSAHLAEMLFEACIDECPEDELYLAPVSELDIAPCVACDACKGAAGKAARAKLAAHGIAVEEGDAVGEGAAEDGAAGEDPAIAADAAAVPDGDADQDDLAPIAYCPRFDDDMLELYEILADADELTIVAPVFFSGPPAPLAALLDRLQPFFWEWLGLRAAGEGGRRIAAQKRPATLHVIGEGLDKNGYVSLVSKVRSALAPAGFELGRVLDWVGKIAPDGTIQGEAAVYGLPPLGMPLVSSDAYLRTVDDADESGDAVAADHAPAHSQAKAAAEMGDRGAVDGRGGRPKLDLGTGNGGSRARSGDDGKTASAKGKQGAPKKDAGSARGKGNANANGGANAKGNVNANGSANAKGNVNANGSANAKGNANAKGKGGGRHGGNRSGRSSQNGKRHG